MRGWRLWMSHHHAGALGRYLADVSTGSEPPAENTTAQTGVSTGADAGESELKNSLRPKPDKGWIRASLWPWPAIAIAVIALAGYVFGWLGAVVATGQAVASLLFVAGDTLLTLRKRAWLAISAVVAGAAVVLVLLWQTHALGFVRSSNPVQTAGSTDLTGRTVTQAMLKSLNLRGALLSGTRLDHLSLTGQSLNGAVAPGSSFIGSDLRRVPMRGAELSGAISPGHACAAPILPALSSTGPTSPGPTSPESICRPSVRRTLIGKPASPGTHVPSCH